MNLNILSQRRVGISISIISINLVWFLLVKGFHDLNLSGSEYKHIIRIAGKDIEGSRKMIVALSEVKGIGYNFAQILLQSLHINPNIRVGFLSDKELADIEASIKNPAKSGMPDWYMNRRKDITTGSNQHLITSDLDFAILNDIDREKTVMSWRGYRHMFGLKVRGQHTRTTGRRGGAVGVKKISRPMVERAGVSEGRVAVAGGGPATAAATPQETGVGEAQPQGQISKTGGGASSKEPAKK
jgi:small subunit ribosomal protein S13